MGRTGWPRSSAASWPTRKAFQWINGELVRASDGRGLRAFAMSSGRITEHARLFKVSNLQLLMNSAAILQIASVIVAQKHLADISRKLDEIKNGIAGISSFLDNQRKSRINATYAYLEQIRDAIKAGDLPDSARPELESCERDLLEIQWHLTREFRQKLEKKVEHTETVGTGALKTALTNKISELKSLGDDLACCLSVRVAAWHVLSLFPGEPNLKGSRRTNIRQSIENFCSLTVRCQEEIQGEINNFKSKVNRPETLKKRRTELSDKLTAAIRAFEDKTSRAADQIDRSEQILLEGDRPTRMLLLVNDGVLVGARKASAR